MITRQSGECQWVAAKRSVVAFGGIGMLPRAPASVAAAVGALLLYAFRPRPAVHSALVVSAVCLGQVMSREFVNAEDADPQQIVIDEIAGVWLTFLGIRMTTGRCLLGAALFRSLDKLKPGLIGVVDRRGGRWSVMGDDLIAGAGANLVLRAWTKASGPHA